MIKRFLWFLLLVFLFALAVAFVHGLDDPELSGTLFTAIGNAWVRFVIFLGYTWDGFRAAFWPGHYF